MENLNYIQNKNIESLIFNKRKSKKDNLKDCKRAYKLDCHILIKTKNLDKNTWFKVKKLGISGTDIACIVRANKYKSPMAVYLDKITEEVMTEENEKMYFGKVLEDVVAKEFAKRNPHLKVSKVNAVLKHKEYDFAIANIDRLIRNENDTVRIKNLIVHSNIVHSYTMVRNLKQGNLYLYKFNIINTFTGIIIQNSI